MSDTIGSMWLRIAREDNWDSSGGRKTTDAAINTASFLTSCPMPSGGLQIELHARGGSVEIVIDDEGQLRSVMWERP